MTQKKKKFYELSINERLQQLADVGQLNQDDLAALSGVRGLTAQQADHMIENVVGIYGLPLGIAQNFVVNGREVLVPMVIEEPSVVAAASYMARLAQSGGGFKAETSPAEMIGQMQILDVKDLQAARKRLLAKKQKLIELADSVDPLLHKLGGGARDVEVRIIEESPIGPFLVLHLIMDVRDAMGANAINTALEQLTPLVEEISGGRVLLCILSNLAARRLARARCIIPLSELACNDFSAEQVRDGIIAAWAFAAADPYRAATHN